MTVDERKTAITNYLAGGPALKADLAKAAKLHQSRTAELLEGMPEVEIIGIHLSGKRGRPPEIYALKSTPKKAKAKKSAPKKPAAKKASAVKVTTKVKPKPKTVPKKAKPAPVVEADPVIESIADDFDSVDFPAEIDSL